MEGDARPAARISMYIGKSICVRVLDVAQKNTRVEERKRSNFNAIINGPASSFHKYDLRTPFLPRAGRFIFQVGGLHLNPN